LEKEHGEEEVEKRIKEEGKRKERASESWKQR
jgi:hypothetical protein